jgi:hypothetical protein
MLPSGLKDEGREVGRSLRRSRRDHSNHRDLVPRPLN